jgi:hypothetical protein
VDFNGKGERKRDSKMEANSNMMALFAQCMDEFDKLKLGQT